MVCPPSWSRVVIARWDMPTLSPGAVRGVPDGGRGVCGSLRNLFMLHPAKGCSSIAFLSLLCATCLAR